MATVVIDVDTKLWRVKIATAFFKSLAMTDDKLTGLPPRIVVRGGNDIVILHEFRVYTD